MRNNRENTRKNDIAPPPRTTVQGGRPPLALGSRFRIMSKLQLYSYTTVRREEDMEGQEMRTIQRERDGDQHEEDRSWQEERDRRAWVKRGRKEAGAKEATKDYVIRNYLDTIENTAFIEKLQK